MLYIYISVFRKYTLKCTANWSTSGTSRQSAVVHRTVNNEMILLTALQSSENHVGASRKHVVEILTCVTMRIKVLYILAYV